MSGTLVLPVPRYPASVVTDASLKVAANQIQTTLALRVSSLDSVFKVSDTSRLVVDMLLSIDNEIVSVSSIDAGQSTIAVVRGFDGTVATPHNAGRLLQAFIHAWHHNALAAEVKAIEAALGANLSNITGSTAIVSRSYAWVRQPGGTLSVGNNVITLTPVPAGVNGSNANHYVYVSGGTGAAEACLITGGTAVGGSATGTIIINCANAHTGSWSVGTATAGIQEAVHAVGSSGIPIQIPEGDHTIYATTTIPYSKVSLRGNGMGLTRIGSGAGMVTVDAFLFQGPAQMGYNSISNLSIWGQSHGSQSAGWAIHAENQIYFLASEVYTQEWPNGVWFNNAHISQLADVYVMDIRDVTGIGAQVEGASSYAGRFDRVIVQGNITPGGTSKPFAGVRIKESADLIMNNSHFMTCTTGLVVDPAAGKSVSSLKCVGCYFDNSWGNGAEINPAAGGAVVRCDFLSCWFSDSKQGSGLVITEAGGEVNGVMVQESQFYRNAHAGLYVASAGPPARFTGFRVDTCVFAGNSNQVPNTDAGAFFNADNWMFTNNRSGPADGFANSQTYGLYVYGPLPRNNYLITGNDLSGNLTGGLADLGTGQSKVIRNNLGVSNVIATIASAATIGLGGNGVETIKITGTTPISTINTGWIGRAITLIFVDTGPGGLIAIGGGNIGRQQIPALYESVQLLFDGAKWY